MDEMLGQDKGILAYHAQSGWASALRNIPRTHERTTRKISNALWIENETDIVDTANARRKTQGALISLIGAAARARPDLAMGPKILPASRINSLYCQVILYPSR